jgi:hypothetical protein
MTCNPVIHCVCKESAASVSQIPVLYGLAVMCENAGCPNHNSLSTWHAVPNGDEDAFLNVFFQELTVQERESQLNLAAL